MKEKVLHVCMSRGKGGMELYVGRVIKDLKDFGWDVYGICLKNTKVSEYMEKEGIENKTFSSNASSLACSYEIARWVRGRGIKVIHCHKSSDLRLALLLKVLVKGLVVFYTDHVGGRSKKKDFYHRLAYGAVSRVFSISDATYQRNIENLPLPIEKITCLHHGVDVSRYSPYASSEDREIKRASLGCLPNSVLICLPGRVTPGKGQELWVKAISLLPENINYFAISVGGTSISDGGIDGYYEKLVDFVNSKGLEEKVKFLGHREDLHEILPASDIVCIPSINEAFGLTVIESMASGVAVIGSSSGSLPELLGSEAGMLVKAEDAVAWADAIKHLIENPSVRKLFGEAARKRSVGFFSKASHVESLVGYYRGKA